MRAPSIYQYINVTWNYMHLNGHQKVVHVCVCLVGVDVGGQGRESSLSNLTRLENDLQRMGAIMWKCARQTRA